MTRKALRRAVGACILLITVSLLLGRGFVGSTFALVNGAFTGDTTNNNSVFAGGWIGAPTLLSPTLSGYDVKFAWTPGTHGPVTGQQLWGVDNTTSSTCSSPAYASLATMASASTAAYTDANRASTINGDWFCYEMVSTSGTVPAPSAWTAAQTISALQIGLAARAVSLGTGGGSINRNDTITLTFNQKTNLTTASVKVCSYATSVIIGDPSGGTTCPASASSTYSIGKLSETGATIALQAWASSTVALSGTNPQTVTITLTATHTATWSGGTPSWTFTPSSSVLSSVTVDQAAACTSGANCQPTASTNF